MRLISDSFHRPEIEDTVQKMLTVQWSRDSPSSTQHNDHTIITLSYHHRQSTAAHSSVPRLRVDAPASPEPQ